MTDKTLPGHGDPRKDQATLPSGSPSSGDEEELISGGKVMSVFDHLDELRSRLVKSLAVITVLFFVCFAFAEHIIGYLKQPLMAALPEGQNALHFTSPLDVFIVDLKIAALAALVISCPVWIHQFWKFFEPALYPRERKYILPFVVASVALFFGGIAFCYYVILPMTLHFLIGMGLEVGTPIITITDYVSLLTLFIFGFGLVFEAPVILVLLAMLDLISVETLTHNRRFVVVAILVVAAIATPSPDPFSQLALATPVYLMYELAILIIKFLKRRERTGA